MTSAERPAAFAPDAPLVSVVMPFLNAEHFIAEAVDSVLPGFIVVPDVEGDVP